MNKIATTALLLALALSSCATGGPRQKMLALEKTYLSDEVADDPTFASIDALLPKMSGEAAKLLHLEISGKKHLAAWIYFCEEITKKFSCAHRYADDTIHTSEFPPLFPSGFIKTSETKAKVVRLGGLLAPVFFMGEAREMHDSGYQKVVEIKPDKDQLINLNAYPAQPGDDKILFTIIKDKDDPLFKKYVWVVYSAKPKTPPLKEK